MADRFNYNRTLSSVRLDPDREYAVELRWAKVAAFGLHYFWVLRDPATGKDIAEVHGFPRYENGMRNRTLAVDGSPFTIEQNEGENRPYTEAEQNRTHVRFVAKGRDIEPRWNDTLERMKFFNEQDMTYASGGEGLRGGVNSNAAAFTFGREFGFSSLALKAVRPGKAQPGWGVDLNRVFRGAVPSDRWFESATPEESEDFLAIDKKIRARDFLPDPSRPDLGLAPARDEDDPSAPVRPGIDAADSETLHGGSGKDALLGGAGNDELNAEAERLIASNDYYDNERKQSRVAAIFKTLYPPVSASPSGEAFSGASKLGRAPGIDDPPMPEPVRIIEPFPFERDFASAPGTVDSPQGLLGEADALIGADDYWRDPHKQRRVALIFRRLYPGQVRTAPLDFGEGA
jgi:hypothetical protein